MLLLVSIPAAQKSGLSAMGAEVSAPKKFGFSAQTASGQSPMSRR
jgi:hypothetical protein